MIATVEKCEVFIAAVRCRGRRSEGQGDGVVDRYRRGELTFEVVDRGPADGPPVVLLHGFPQFNTSWEPVMERLAADGYHCVAPNQRGYSPGAQPRRRRDYVAEELVGDVVALIDALGVQKVHVVGHDWGAAVAWGMSALVPDRVATMTAFSVPHPAAFFTAMATSRQGLASWYMYIFQLPWLPERWLNRGGGTGLTWFTSKYLGQSRAAAARDCQGITANGALTTALNWYRAVPFNKPGLIRTKVAVPAMHVWSDGDKACCEKGSSITAQFVTGEYRFEILRGVSHWIPDECPDVASRLLLNWFADHPIVPG